MTDPNDEGFITAAFEALDTIEPSANLRRRIAQIPIEHPSVETRVWPLTKVWHAMAAFSALAALGIVTGNLSGAEANDGSARSAEVILESNDNSRSTQADPESSMIANNSATEVETDDPLEGLLALALAEDWDSWEQEVMQ